MRPTNARRPGITPVEAMVGFGIFVIVIGLVLAAVQRVRDAASHSQSTNNLKQMGTAVNGFAASSSDSYLPPAVGTFAGRVLDGTLRDTVVYSIISSEWPSIRSHLRYQLTRLRS